MKKIAYYIVAPFRFLYKIYFVVVFLLLAIPMYPIFFFLLKSEKNVHKAFKLKKIWAKMILFFTAIKVKKINQELLPKPPYVICANHASYLDIVVMFVLIPETFLFLGKAELLKWPIIRIFFRNMDIPIDRSNNMRARRSIELTKTAVQKGFSIAIFPEGLIPNEGIPAMKPFKKGAFVLAISQQVPIVPITFSNNWKLFGTESDVFGPGRPGIAKCIFHDPIYTEGLKIEGINELIKKTYSKIESEISY
jgi:1-acyl-sn-glycerol-3-phosphate acyltransferase